MEKWVKKHKNAKKLNEDELTIGGVRLVTSKNHAFLKILGPQILFCRPI
jgi:hypothetical protein